jgi:UDP-N-acetylglucosamine transferase subunit ALG13
MVAAAGGHLEELWRLRPRFASLSGDVTWVTTDTPQARSLLAGEQRLFAPSALPRDVGATIANLRLAHHVLALTDWTDVVSTGPLMAVPFLTLARARGIRCHFIESSSRVTGPSLTAKILERIPGVHCYSPYPWWHRRSWLYRGSVLDGFAPAPVSSAALDRVVVTVGTSNYGFRRMIQRIAEVLPGNCEVLWQVGVTDVTGLGIEAQSLMPRSELSAAMAEADLVVSHAGVGSALTAMCAGRAPLLVPRRSRFGEHVDDHQLQIADELERRGLALTCDLQDFERAFLWKAASTRVSLSGELSPFALSEK